MKKFLVGSALIWAVALPAFGQAKAPKQPQKHVQVQPVAARPEDVASIEAIVKASYETISGGVGVPRQWGRDESLFDPNVRFVSVERDPNSGAIVTTNTTHQEFVDEADEFTVKEGFTETRSSPTRLSVTEMSPRCSAATRARTHPREK